MKKLLLGVLVLSSFSAFTQDTLNQNAETYSLDSNGVFTIKSSFLKTAEEMHGREYNEQSKLVTDISSLDKNTIVDRLFFSRNAPVVEGAFFGDEQGYTAANGAFIIVSRPYEIFHVAVGVDGRRVKLNQTSDDITVSEMHLAVSKFLELSSIEIESVQVGRYMDLYAEKTSLGQGRVRLSNLRFIVESEYSNYARVEQGEAQKICSLIGKSFVRATSQDGFGMSLIKAKRFTSWKQISARKARKLQSKKSLATVICN